MKFHSLGLVYFLVDYWIMHFSFLCANRTYFMFNHFNSIINSLELGLLFNFQYWLKGPLKIPGSFPCMPGKQQREQQLIAAMGVLRFQRKGLSCIAGADFFFLFRIILLGWGQGRCLHNRLAWLEVQKPSHSLLMGPALALQCPNVSAISVAGNQIKVIELCTL